LEGRPSNRPMPRRPETKQSCAAAPTGARCWAKAQAPASRRTADPARLDPRDSGRQGATTPSCRRLVLSALVLAAERISASDLQSSGVGGASGSSSTLGGAGSQARAASESQNGRLTEHRRDQTSRLKSRSVTSVSGSQQSFVELIARRRAASASRSQTAPRGTKRRWSISRFRDLLVARSNALILVYRWARAFIRRRTGICQNPQRRYPGPVDGPP
jgi:hypothetical protein